MLAANWRLFLVRGAMALAKEDHERNHYVAVRGLQEPQLHDDEKQEEALRTSGDEKILQYVPQAHGTQRS